MPHTETGARLDAANPPAEDFPGLDESSRVPLAMEDRTIVVILVLLACITLANVVVRHFTGFFFAWTEEFSVFLMILLATVAGSAAIALRSRVEPRRPKHDPWRPTAPARPTRRTSRRRGR